MPRSFDRINVMRIIAGRFKRRVLAAPTGTVTRPTTDQMREAIFNLVTARLDLDQIAVLDLFSGTGALGLEAMSRGAGHLDGIEVSAASIKVARANAFSLDPKMSVRFISADVYRWIKQQKKETYQLILADPPYGQPGIELLLEEVVPLLSPKGLFVLEHDRQTSFQDHESFEVTRSYGKSSVSLFSPQNVK
mgnify:CR=1 FL=1